MPPYIQDPGRLARLFWLAAALVLLVFAGTLRPLHAQSARPNDGALEAATVRLHFPNSPVSAILPYYEKLTGARIVQDANLTGVNLSISSEKPLTRLEAISYIESVFLLNGFAFLPIDGDSDTLKLINFAAGKSLRSQGLPVIATPSDLPQTDAVVNYVMQLENITPDEAVRTFSQVVSLNPYGAITPLGNANGVVITENTSVIRSLLELQSHVDVPPAQVANQFIKLERADAEKIAELIGGIFEQQTGNAATVSITGQQSVPGNGNGTGPGSPGSVGNANASGAASPPVMIVPYRRTNSLLVIARPVDLRYIESLVLAFDQPGDGANFLKQTLRYVSITDYLPVFYNALARGTDIESDGDQLLEAAAHGAGHSSSNSALGATSTGGFGGAAGDHISTPDRLSEPEDKGMPESYVVGNTLLISDPQANTLIASGSPEHLEIIRQLIDEIDVEPRQVYISTIIGQLRIGDEFEYGLDALQGLDTFKVDGDARDLLGAGTLNSNGGSATDVTTLDDIKNFDFAKGLSLYGQFTYGDMHTVSGVLRAFARDQRFRLLSRPSVYAQNNVKAMISSGQRIAVPVSTLTSVNNGLNSEFPGSVASNIEYRDVVLKLEVIPLINSDDKVTLKIAQLNDNIVGSQNISGNEIPTLSTQELITTITVRNGETIVLGGLITEREEENVTGIPIIRRIPVVGRIFGGTEKDMLREELLIFIQPHIIPSGEHKSGGLTTNDLERHRTGILEETLEFADPHLEPSSESKKARNHPLQPYQGPRGRTGDR
jgi:type II secretion system protein D